MEPHNARVWFITGTSSGFGRRIATIALARGDRVVASARSLAALEKVLPRSDRLHLLELDVTAGADAIKAKVDAAARVWGQIDVLVNNAGVAQPSLVEEGGVEKMKEQFEINVFGLLNVTNAVLPWMRARRSGIVVMIGSRSAWRPEILTLGFYAASKAAVHSLGETLSGELAQFSIRVMIVEPGAFRTEGIYGQNFHTSNPIPDYDAMRTAAKARFEYNGGKQKGDPDKAAEAIVDVVRGEGRARGRELPLYLFLGEDVERDVNDKIGEIRNCLEGWKDVTRSLNIDTPAE